MTTQRADVYVPITSITKADGGRTRIVTGVAVSDRLDMDGQRADYEWAKAAAGEWFKRWGNVREQHGAVAAGKAIAIDFDDVARKVTVTSKAVDPGTVAKLDEGVLTGYSWGAKSVPGNPIKVIKDATGVEWVKGGAWAELSYVDHPCNYDCTIAITKTAKGGQRLATKAVGVLDAGDIPGGQDYDAILRGMLSDIAKRDVSAAERERLGDQGHAIDTGQDHPSYPIANQADLKHAIEAYGRANPDDRAKLRRHIISEAKRLNRSDMIPDDWKSAQALVKQAQCNCCDDCGPDCGGDCCPDCTMTKAAAGPAAILAGVKTLAERETDDEYRAFLGKLVAPIEAWGREPGATLDFPSFKTLTTLSAAAAEPDIAKARTFYTQGNRAAAEQALYNLHQALGLALEGGGAADADKDQRNDTLTGLDAPAADDQPGGPGTAPGDGNPGDGNLALDPSLVRDGDPAIRTPDGQRDGRAQGEAGTHTWPPAGDAPGKGPGDQGKGEPPGGKGREPFDGQQLPAKAAKRLARLERELQELRKAASAPATPVQVSQTLGPPAAAPRKAGGKGLRRDIAALTETVRKTLEVQQQVTPLELRTAPDADEVVGRLEKRLRKVTERAGDDASLRAEVARATAAVSALASRPADGPQQAAELRLEIAKALDKLERRMTKRLAAQTPPAPDLGPLGAQLAELQKAVEAQHAALSQRPDGPPQIIDNSLLLANLTKVAFEETRKDLTKVSGKLTKRVKRAERKLQKAAKADSERLQRVAQNVDDLGRRPHPSGPALTGPQEKVYPVNQTIERSASPELAKEIADWRVLADSTDQVVAVAAQRRIRQLLEQHGLTS